MLTLFLASQTNKGVVEMVLIAEKFVVPERLPISDIAKILNQQEVHSNFLGKYGLTGPAWDILLRIVWLVANGEKPCVTDLCHLAKYPYSSTIRHISTLEERTLIIRQPDRIDGRRWFLHLSDQGEKLVRQYVECYS